MTSSLGSRLRQLRRERRITLQSLARDLGVHFTTVSAWERGRSHPDLGSLRRLAGHFGVGLAELLGEEGAQRPSLRLEVWGRARWEEFMSRTATAQVLAALWKVEGGEPRDPGVRDALRSGLLSSADLLRLGSLYEVERIDKGANGASRPCPVEPGGAERRLRSLPPALRALVENQMAEWLDLFASLPGPRGAADKPPRRRRRGLPQHGAEST